MLVISGDQMAVFANARRTQFVVLMCDRLREQFPTDLWGVEQNTLHSNIAAALLSANRYGLHSERDCCRYLNLAVLYGWEFDRLDGNAWMRSCLTDMQISTPSQRLNRLVDQCLHRSEVAEHNRNLRVAMSLAASGSRR